MWNPVIKEWINQMWHVFGNSFLLRFTDFNWFPYVEYYSRIIPNIVDVLLHILQGQFHLLDKRFLRSILVKVVKVPLFIFFGWQLLSRSKCCRESFPYTQHQVAPEDTRSSNEISILHSLWEVEVNSGHDITRERLVSSESSCCVVELKTSSTYLDI